MLNIKFNKYKSVAALLLILTICLFAFLNYSNCNVFSAINSSKTFGIKNSIKGCETNIKNFWYFKIRKLFINTIFEEKLRIYKAEKHGSRYVILKKRIF